MLKNSLAYFVLWILLQLLVKVNCQMRARIGHTATLIDNKLYIVGGSNTSEEFFYLDVSAKFNTKYLLWHNLTSINTVPPHSGAASVKGGANNNTLFLFGGSNLNMKVYTFDQQSNTWSIPTIASSINVHVRVLLLGIIDYKGKMYLWGGLETSIYALNEMLILDTINNLSWKGSLVGAPPASCHYGATLLPDQSIIYMGGAGQAGFDDLLPLNQVYIYDTINNNWSTKTTLGKIPSTRYGFSAILGLDGQRIILFGGSSKTGITSGDSLYVLNLINFEWYIPKISGQIPSTRNRHKANLIGKFMVISFGEGYNQSNESDILLLDISNNEEYIWTNDFILSSEPSPASPSATSPGNPQSDKLSLSIANIAGAIVGSLVGGILISFGCFFLYKWNKNKQKQKVTILIPGNENKERTFNNPRQENIKSNLIPINNSHNYGQEISQTPRNESTTNHEPVIPAREINESYNHGQEAISITNNEMVLTQNIDDLKNEIKQDIIREMLQNLQNNNVQASSSNNNDK